MTIIKRNDNWLVQPKSLSKQEFNYVQVKITIYYLFIVRLSKRTRFFSPIVKADVKTKLKISSSVDCKRFLNRILVVSEWSCSVETGKSQKTISIQLLETVSERENYFPRVTTVYELFILWVCVCRGGGDTLHKP